MPEEGRGRRRKQAVAADRGKVEDGLGLGEREFRGINEEPGEGKKGKGRCGVVQCDLRGGEGART